MPSTTPEQQRLFGQAYAIKTGKMKPGDLNPEYRDQIVKLADSMTLKQLKDYAETKHSEMKKENNIPTFKDFVNEGTLNESGTIKIGNQISEDLTKFLKDVVIAKSKGYVHNERDAALLLFDVLKHRYNI
jgi:hypothetical protein